MTFTLEEAMEFQKKEAARYKFIVNSEDFEDKLAKAILNDECLLCGDGQILKHGLCLGCCVGMDNRLPIKVLRDYEVSVSIRRVRNSK